MKLVVTNWVGEGVISIRKINHIFIFTYEKNRIWNLQVVNAISLFRGSITFGFDFSSFE